MWPSAIARDSISSNCRGTFSRSSFPRMARSRFPASWPGEGAKRSAAYAAQWYAVAPRFFLFPWFFTVAQVMLFWAARPGGRTGRWFSGWYAQAAWTLWIRAARAAPPRPITRGAEDFGPDGARVRIRGSWLLGPSLHRRVDRRPAPDRRPGSRLDSGGRNRQHRSSRLPLSHRHREPGFRVLPEGHRAPLHLVRGAGLPAFGRGRFHWTAFHGVAASISSPTWSPPSGNWRSTERRP